MIKAVISLNVLCVILAVVAACVLLAGCSRLGGVFAPQPAPAYAPGENFGDGGATRCGYVTSVVPDLPPCK